MSLFGAEIGHIWVLPGNGSWGQMSYTLPAENPTAHFWVSVAPSLTGFVVGLAFTVLAVNRPPRRAGMPSGVCIGTAP